LPRDRAEAEAATDDGVELDAAELGGAEDAYQLLEFVNNGNLHIHHKKIE